MIRLAVNPDLLRWARERSGIPRESLAARFKKLPEWEDGETRPTLKQLEAFARAVHVPVGYLFFTEPPEEAVPIPDFRTFAAYQKSATCKESLLVRARGCRRVHASFGARRRARLPLQSSRSERAVGPRCRVDVTVGGGSFVTSGENVIVHPCNALVQNELDERGNS